MKISINSDRCNACGLCAKVCPELFLFREGQLVPHLRTDSPHHRLRWAVSKAVNGCPTRAISTSSDSKPVAAVATGG